MTPLIHVFVCATPLPKDLHRVRDIQSRGPHMDRHHCRTQTPTAVRRVRRFQISESAQALEKKAPRRALRLSRRDVGCSCFGANVRLQARAAREASSCKPLVGGARN